MKIGNFVIHKRKTLPYIHRNELFSASNRKISAYLTFDQEQKEMLFYETNRLTHIIIVTIIPIWVNAINDFNVIYMVAGMLDWVGYFFN